MSAFAAYMSNDKFVVATDTLSFNETENTTLNGSIGQSIIKPYGLTQKIETLNNYRCCMVIFGHHKTHLDLYAFIHRHAGCTSIEYLIQSIEKGFFNYIDLNTYDRFPGCEKMHPGVIQVFAYSEIERQMVWYLIVISWSDLKVLKKQYQPGSVITVPFIVDKAKEMEICTNPNTTIKDVLIALMQQQYAESLKEDSRSIAIGGEILLSTLCTKPNFSISSEIVYRFDNFDAAMDGFNYYVLGEGKPVFLKTT